MTFNAHASLESPLLKELNDSVLPKFREREQKTHEEASMPNGSGGPVGLACVQTLPAVS